jgi:hypothetical protein
VLPPRVFAFCEGDDRISKEGRINKIHLIAAEVMPPVREIG